jgi:hypothetical protein
MNSTLELKLKINFMWRHITVIEKPYIPLYNVSFTGCL